MPNEVFIYSDINSYSAIDFIREMNDLSNSDIVVRINSKGGSPEYGWGMVSKFSEHVKSKKVKVDGQAHSTALYFLAYADDVEALNVSQFVLHRASYGIEYEKTIYFTESQRNYLDNINGKLREALEAKINVSKFEELKGVTMDDVFDMKNRIDVTLTAEEAKEIGLVNKIVNLNNGEKTQIESKMLEVAAHYSGFTIPEAAPQANKQINNNNSKNKRMNLESLKAEHPELFAQIKGLGVSEERERVGAWSAWSEIDAKRVIEGIKSGEVLTPTVTSELQVTAFKNSNLQGLEGESSTEVVTPIADTEPVVTPNNVDSKDEELASVEAKMMQALKLSNPEIK